MARGSGDERGPYDGLVAAAVDRLGRNVVDGLNTGYKMRDENEDARHVRARRCLEPRRPRRREPFHRTLPDEWACAKPYHSEAEHREAFPRWLHTCNHHRGHTAPAGKPPASRVPDLTGQHT
ncbi:putative transposase [Streptomyces griseus subsp. griseus NBRC 13350]|uniref:Transposase n=1 Tax=Streptomyces griseus subsp. griseus (strain JCM 4626 / CBS 651.72 / NBRC 13350 / KCC S-0626 / ISP 5235) TaxID=455632 RepID=B1W5L1_STRGG|nr:putative transposase [Streptomyces griseus subsp. griseus NBRC 13350]SEE39658.1 hypothetical protein SAMN04490359_3094 [Streptomyces griseus]